MRELPALEGDYEEPTTSKPKSPTRYNIEKNLDNVDLGVLKDMGYPRPNDFFFILTLKDLEKYAMK